MTYGALPLAVTNGYVEGRDRVAPDRPRHRMLADGDVEIRAGGVRLVISDEAARRLCWAMLADLAPDEAIPMPEVVTYREAQRLAVLRAVAGGARTAIEVAGALEWSLRVAQRRIHELIEDGRLGGRVLGSTHPGPLVVVTD